MKKIFLPMILIAGLAQAAFFKATSFDLTDSETGYEGIASNAVSDIMVLSDSVIFAATSNGLSISQDAGTSFESYFTGLNNMGYGSVSAIEILGQHIWIATVFDSAGVDEVSGTGSGISHSADGGLTWTHTPQMIDPGDSNTVRIYGRDIPALPVTVPIDNITFDLAAHVNSSGDTLIWATSFAGGTRVSRDFGVTWRRVVLPPDGQRYLNPDADLDFDYSPVTREDLGIYGNYNHESFSVIAYGDTVAVGTAAGINISLDCGYTWENFSHGNSGVTGNFVVALHRSDDGTIYGGVLPALGSTEFQSLVYSRRPEVMSNRFWEHSLDHVRIYNISSQGDRIYAASKTGGWLSRDSWNWIQMNYPRDAQTGNILYSDEIYALVPDFQGRVWAGTNDGLAVTADDGLDWTLIRRTEGLGTSPEILMSAYPNPFSPSRMNVLRESGHVRVFMTLPGDGDVDLDIYDFAMQPVKNLVRGFYGTRGDHEFIWDGRNAIGDICANGVYFIRCLQESSSGTRRVTWTKLIILE